MPMRTAPFTPSVNCAGRRAGREEKKKGIKTHKKKGTKGAVPGTKAAVQRRGRPAAGVIHAGSQ